MNGEYWRRVDRIFHDVLERAPRDRESFLERMCADDPSLKKEVEDLLQSHDRAGSFLDVPPQASVSLVGRTFGSYEVKALIGAGNMGEVYRARDSRLKRDVAIKVL